MTLPVITPSTPLIIYARPQRREVFSCRFSSISIAGTFVVIIIAHCRHSDVTTGKRSARALARQGMFFAKVVGKFHINANVVSQFLKGCSSLSDDGCTGEFLTCIIGYLFFVMFQPPTVSFFNSFVAMLNRSTKKYERSHQLYQMLFNPSYS